MRTHTILVIDDEKNIRETIVDVLDVSGYYTESAQNGAEGVKKILNAPPDLVLCDVNMPEMDGFEVLSTINDHFQSENEQLPLFIFLTARIEKKDIRKGINLGADDYILKPFSNKDLLDAVKAKLKQRGELQEAILVSERSRISRSMHDSAQQKFIRAFYALKSVKNENKALSEEDMKMLNYSHQELKIGLEELRDIIQNLPQYEESQNLEEELNTLARKVKEGTGIETTITYSAPGKITGNLATQLYSIVQECCTNVMKHSQSNKIDIEVYEKDKLTCLSVKDYGVGFNVDESDMGLGLRNIKHRVKEINGTIQIESTPNKGTVVSISFSN